MPDLRGPKIDVGVRITQLEKRRATLLARAAASAAMGRMYERMLTGNKTGARSSVKLVTAERAALVKKYRELQSTRLAEAAIAKAHARCLSIEICALRVISGESLQGAQR